MLMAEESKEKISTAHDALSKLFKKSKYLTKYCISTIFFP
jgi:hypothetical protein